MSCSNPKLFRCAVGDNGDFVYTYRGDAKWIDVKDLGTVDDLANGKPFYEFVVPCGRCLGCRIDYSHCWADRMAIELTDSRRAVFVTLTYNNAHLSLAASGRPELSVRDVQLFFKRLRKAFPDRRIRYYLAGEYGPRTLRPHYHAIIYGISLDDFHDLKCFGFNELKQQYFTSPKFEAIWSNGFVQMSEVNYKTCAYVSRYVLKKHYSNDVDFKKLGIHPEFNVSSRRPGIGMLHAEDYVFSGETRFTIDCGDGPHEFNLPKAFIRHCHDLDVDFCNSLVYTRSRDAVLNLKSNVEFSGKSFFEYLGTLDKDLYKRIKLLPDRK